MNWYGNIPKGVIIYSWKDKRAEILQLLLVLNSKCEIKKMKSQYIAFNCNQYFVARYRVGVGEFFFLWIAMSSLIAVCKNCL